jgi:hypothetical protein
MNGATSGTGSAKTAAPTILGRVGSLEERADHNDAREAERDKRIHDLVDGMGNDFARRLDRLEGILGLEPREIGVDEQRVMHGELRRRAEGEAGMIAAHVDGPSTRVLLEAIVKIGDQQVRQLRLLEALVGAVKVAAEKAPERARKAAAAAPKPAAKRRRR